MTPVKLITREEAEAQAALAGDRKSVV